MLLAAPGIQRRNKQRALAITVARIPYQEPSNAADDLSDSHDGRTHLLVAKVGEEDDEHAASHPLLSPT